MTKVRIAVAGVMRAAARRTLSGCLAFGLTLCISSCKATGKSPRDNADPHNAQHNTEHAREGTTSATEPKLRPFVPDAALRSRLTAALEAKGPDYVPRTKHLSPDGRPKYTNRLILQTSPYLLQHAHNPVNWMPWGKEAHALAKKLGRPIFLSVGYSTCHWCHVMEEESFEDEEIAAFLNENYVPVKVDREERPDLDSIYMTAVQLLTKRGGWPMSVWMTPELTPFFGGTYFPARDNDRGRQVGFLTLLKRHAEAYRTDPAQITAKAQSIADDVRRAMRPEEVGDGVNESVVLKAYQQARNGYDVQHGGRRGFPKFPSGFPIDFLLQLGSGIGPLGQNQEVVTQSQQMALRTLSKMARGGIYDQVGGGFHRYSVDENWLIPHFEKMLYDNGLLAHAYVRAHQLSGQAEYRRIAEETLDYVAREMTSPAGGFYSATDADSLVTSRDGVSADRHGHEQRLEHRQEGYYFTWTPAELTAALSEDDAQLATSVYSVTEQGNFESRSVLFLRRSLDAAASRLDLPLSELLSRLKVIKERLRAARNQRPSPRRDDKIQVSWNGLMLRAFAAGAHVFASDRYLDIARRNAEFVLSRLRAKGRLRHSIVGDGQADSASPPAFLEDYAFYSSGLLELFQATQDPKFLTSAIELMHELEKWHADNVGGGYFLTSNDHERLLVREKPDLDKAIPNGNSLALLNHALLYQFTLDETWRQRAETTLRAFSNPLKQNPRALSQMMSAVYFLLNNPRQLALVWPDDAGQAQGESLLEVLRSSYFPSLVVAQGTESQLGALTNYLPWLKDKRAAGGQATAYVCQMGHCKRPATDADTLRKQLREP